MNSKQSNSKSKKGNRQCPRCTNPKCRRIGHTFEQCWSEGGGAEGQRPNKASGSDSAKCLPEKDEKLTLLLAEDHTPTPSPPNWTEWIIDSGASAHLCSFRDWFTTFTTLNPPRSISLGDNRTLNATGVGQIEITIHNGNGEHTILQNVLFCPGIGANLLSVVHLTKVGAVATFSHEGCELFNTRNERIGTALCRNGLFRLPCTVLGTEKAYITFPSNPDDHEDAKVACTTTASASLDIWHTCLGHISNDSILKMERFGMVKGMEIVGGKHDVPIYCGECEASGHIRSPIPKESLTHSNQVLGHIFSDVCKVETVTHEGFRYFITFVDDFSCYTTVYPMKKKSDALEIFQDFLVEAE